MIWVLIVILTGTEHNEKIFFNDLDTCLEYSLKISSQNFHQRVAGDKIYLKTYCIPKKTE
tara:strand:- start:748 stop:927 length:180 start_codon:yes stop_codon:yes gene_type:complete